MNDSPGSLEQLSTRIGDLERRVHVLEHPEESRVAARVSDRAAAGTEDQAIASDLQAGNVFPVLGRAMLGIAGAYVLRAVTTSGAAPGLLGSAAAVVYALGWLVWSLRTSRSLSRYVYAGTSALILAPMLWEATLHFNVLTPMMAAGVLAGFVTLATGLEAGASGARTAWVMQATTAMMAASLALSTHHVLPFVITLLIALLVTEFARACGFVEPAWPLIALVSDAAIWGILFIYSGPQSVRANYVELPAMSLVMPGCLLLAINGTGVAVRALRHKSRMGIFETVQLLIACVLAAASVLLFAPAHGEIVVGVTCLLLASTIYPWTFFSLEQFADRRNFRVFGVWSVALLLAGVLWTFPRGPASMLLAVAGCAAYFVAARTNSRMLEWHGAILFCTALAISGMPQYVFGALAGSLPGRPEITVFVVLLAAALASGGDRESADNPATRKALQFIPALVGVSGASAFLAHGMLAVSSLVIVPEAHHVAFLRTLTVSLVSLCLAFSGSRWGWATMTRLAYVALAFVAAKLLFEDLRHGHMAFIAGSIFLFAITLIAAPRLARWGAKLRTAYDTEMLAAGKI